MKVIYPYGNNSKRTQIESMYKNLFISTSRYWICKNVSDHKNIIILLFYGLCTSKTKMLLKQVVAALNGGDPDKCDKEHNIITGEKV